MEWKESIFNMLKKYGTILVGPPLYKWEGYGIRWLYDCLAIHGHRLPVESNNLRGLFILMDQMNGKHIVRKSCGMNIASATRGPSRHCFYDVISACTAMGCSFPRMRRL